MPDTNDTNYTTSSTTTRWEGTGTLLALLLVGSVPVLLGLVAANVLTFSGVTQSFFVLYATVALMAAVWTFGEETLAAVRRARGKDVGFTRVEQRVADSDEGQQSTDSGETQQSTQSSDGQRSTASSEGQQTSGSNE